MVLPEAISCVNLRAMRLPSDILHIHLPMMMLPKTKLYVNLIFGDVHGLCYMIEICEIENSTFIAYVEHCFLQIPSYINDET